VSEESFGIVPGLLGINARSPEGYKNRGIIMKIDFSIKNNFRNLDKSY
jgi:hypothetical protein